MIKKIKNQIKNLNKENKTLQVFWDAGNDSTMCHLKIEDTPIDALPGYDEMRGYLVDTVIDVLELPNASEDQHTGEGVLKINENNQITLTYDNVYQSPYPSSGNMSPSHDDETFFEQFAYDDVYGFIPLISRIRITFSAYDEQTIYLNIMVLEGDEFAFGEEAEKHLKEAIQKIILPFYEPFKHLDEENHFWKMQKIPEDHASYADGNKKALYSVFIEGELQADSKIHCIINKYYQYVTYTKNKTIILIP